MDFQLLFEASQIYANDRLSRRMVRLFKYITEKINYDDISLSSSYVIINYNNNTINYDLKFIANDIHENYREKRLDLKQLAQIYIYNYNLLYDGGRTCD